MKNIVEDESLRFVDLKRLIKGQEIPKILYRPVKVMAERIYFEKIMEGKMQYWTDGIYRYDLAEDRLSRVDRGIQEEYPALYELDVPSTYEDVMAFKEMQDIYYGVKMDVGSRTVLNFFRIDVQSDEQYEIMSYEYYGDEYEYEGMEVLTQGYFIFTLTPKFGDENGLEYDRVYLVDVYQGIHYPVRDLPFSMTGGKRAVIGREKKYLFLEEIYLSEEEETEFLLSSDMELVMKIPEDMDESFVYINRLNILPFDNFLRLVKIGAHKYEYEELDAVFEEGLIRTIGETAEKIYYKKARHEHVLKASREFKDRLMIGKEEIFAIDKESLSISKVMDMEEDSILVFEGEHIYEIKETKEHIHILEPDQEQIFAGRPLMIERFSYEKRCSDQGGKEYFYDIFGKRYLAIGVVSEKEAYLKIVDLKGEHADICCMDLFVIDDMVFFG